MKVIRIKVDDEFWEILKPLLSKTQEIVRCKECIHWNKKLKREIYGETKHACQKLRRRFEMSIPYTYADDFCSRGVKR